MPPASCIWARSELAFRPMWRAIRVPDSPAARLVHSSATSASVSGLCRGLYFLRFKDTSFVQVNLACFS